MVAAALITTLAAPATSVAAVVGNQIYVEENDPSIVYLPLDAWVRATGGSAAASYHGGGIARTFTTGASASYVFSGSAIAIIGTKGPDHGSYVVDLDGQPEALVNGACCIPGTNIPQSQLFTKTNLTEGVSHTIVITNTRKGSAGSVLELDSFIVTPHPGTTITSGVASGTTSTSTPEQDQMMNRNAIIGGTVVGSAVFLACIVAGVYVFIRKRNQRRNRLDQMAAIPIPQRTRRSSFFPSFMRSVTSLKQPTVQPPHVIEIVPPKGPISRPQFATSRTDGSAFVEHLTNSTTSLPHGSAISLAVRSIHDADLTSSSHDSLRSPVSFAQHVERDITATHGFVDLQPTPPPPNYHIYVPQEAGHHLPGGANPFFGGSDSTHEAVMLEFGQRGGIGADDEGTEYESHAPSAMRTLQRSVTGYASSIGVDPDMDDERMNPPPPLPPKPAKGATKARPTLPPTYSFDARTFKRKT